MKRWIKRILSSMKLLPETCQTSDEELKRQIEAIFDDYMKHTEIVFQPDPSDPFNLDKTMVWFIRDDPYADMFIKLRPKDGTES